MHWSLQINGSLNAAKFPTAITGSLLSLRYMIGGEIFYHQHGQLRYATFMNLLLCNKGPKNVGILSFIHQLILGLQNKKQRKSNLILPREKTRNKGNQI